MSFKNGGLGKVKSGGKKTILSIIWGQESCGGKREC
jgi:hypothetical protein